MPEKHKPPSDEPTFLVDRLRLKHGPTETIDMQSLFTTDLTESGSFDIRSNIWATTFGKLTQALPIPALLVDPLLTVVMANQATRTIVRDYEALQGIPISDLIHEPTSTEGARVTLERVLSTRNSAVLYAWFGTQRNRVWGRVSLRSVRIASERFALVLIQDLTAERERDELSRKHSEELAKAHEELERKVAQRTRELQQTNAQLRREIAEREGYEESLRQSKDCFNNIVERSSDGILVVDPTGQVLYANPASEQLLGRERDSLLGSQFGIPVSGDGTTNVDVLLQDGETGIAQMRAEFTYWNGNPGYLCILRDITELKRLESDLADQAYRDAATGLTNRRKFLEMLRSACGTASRYSLHLSLCICDLDSFKAINDTYGHLAGDWVLAEFGQILRTELRDSDFAGRYGGDEFVVAFPLVGSSGARRSIERIREKLGSTKLPFASADFRLTMSAGVAQFEPGVTSVEQLIQNADEALYEAKRLGRNRTIVGSGKKNVP